MSDTRIDNPTLAGLADLTEAAIQAAGRGEEAALLAWLDSGGRVNATSAYPVNLQSGERDF